MPKFVVEAHTGKDWRGSDVFRRDISELGAAQRCFDRTATLVSATGIVEVRLWEFNVGKAPKLLKSFATD